VLYLIISATPAASGAYDAIPELQADGWDVCAITTPSGARFVDSARLAALTGHPVRSEYKHPDDPDVLPPGDAFVVAPASFNTVNKIVNGISDTLGVGIVCEAMGYGKPVIIAPWINPALARHGAYDRSIQHLQVDGVSLVLAERTFPMSMLHDPDAPVADPGGAFPWNDVLSTVRQLPNAPKEQEQNHLRPGARQSRRLRA
jgi:phosphopantothenoylcysteine synthetase/decarboxylase